MDLFNDTTRYQQLRYRLVNEVRRKGITDESVLDAVRTVPRHLFIPEDLREHAYEDRPIPIGEGQTISQPYTVAYQTQLLKIKIADKVLEIGTGSMYQACVLSAMGALVYTIERQKKLFNKTNGMAYTQACPGIRLFFGDGFQGLPDYAPFDKILITAAAPMVPPKLVEQLKPGGLMVLPLGRGNTQTMMRVTKRDNGRISEQYFNNFSFVPMLEGTVE